MNAISKIPVPRPNLVDRIVSYFDPIKGAKRWRARAATSIASNYFSVNPTGGYIAPGSARRSMRGWWPRASSPDGDTLVTLPASRAACRDLFMNSALASGALRRVRTNVVGAGLTLQSRIDREFLGLDETEADEWEKKTEREFNLWSESEDCDAARSLTFKELQGLALLSTLMNGDCFVLLPYLNIRNTQMPYKLRIKLVEGDLVSNPMNILDTNLVAGGIELDKMGAPEAYHFLKPQFGGIFSYYFGTWTRIPAFGPKSGRRNVLHLVDRERIGQRRGMPMLATVVEPLKQIQRLTEAELMASVIASFFTVFIKTELGDRGLMETFTEEESLLNKSGDEDSAGADATNRDDNLQELGPGIMNELAEGQSIETADPKRPNDAYDPFFTSIVRQIGASIEIPYEALMMIFQSSYSASRAALQEAWKFYRMRRFWLATRFCQPVYTEWLTEAVMRGRIVAPGFFEDPMIRKAWLGSMWGGMGQGQIDPIKETKAALMRIKGNLSTYEDEYLITSGGDWEKSVIRLSRQNRKLEGLGLPVSSTIKDTGEPGDVTTTAEEQTEEKIEENKDE